MSQIISFKDLLNLDDTTNIDEAIAKIEKLDAVFAKMVSNSEKAAADYTHALDDIAKSAARLDGDMENLDSTLAEHQKLIIASAAQAEKLLSAQEEATKASDNERIALEKLKAAEEALGIAKDKLSEKNLKQAGSIAALKAELSKATKEAENMGDATDEMVKADALKKVGDLTKQVAASEAGLKQAKKAVDVAAGSYDALVIEVSQAKKELKAMEGGIGSNTEKFKALQKTVKDGTDKLKEFDAGVGVSSRSVGDYGIAVDKLDEASGGAVSGVKGLVAGFKMLLTTPVGLVIMGIVLAFKALQEYFTSSVEGQDNWNKILVTGQAVIEIFMDYLEGLGKLLYTVFSEPEKTLKALLDFVQPVTDAIAEAWENPIDAVKAFGQAIVDNILNRFKAVGVAFEAIQMAIDGDLVGSLKKLADAGIQAVTGITDGTDKIIVAYNAVAEVVGDVFDKVAADAQKKLDLAAQLADLENQIRKDKIADVVDDAKTELAVYKKLNEAQDKLRLSANERFAAQKAAGQLLEDQLAGDLELIQKEIKAQQIRMQLADDNYEAREKLAQLQAEEIGLQSAYEKAFKKRQATERQLLEEAEKDRLAAVKREADAQRQLNEVIVKGHVEANKELIADERTSLDDRISLINENAEYARDIAASNRDRDLALAREAGIERVQIDADTLDKIYSQQGATADQINAARREAAIAALETDEAYAAEVQKLNETFVQETTKANEDAINATSDNVFKQWARDYDNLVAKVDSGADTATLALNDALAAGNISYKDYQEQRQSIQDEAQLKQLDSLLAHLKKQSDALKKSGFDTTQIEAEIAKTELAISDAKIAKQIEGEKALQDQLKQLKQVAVEGALQIIDNLNAAEDMKREERLARLDATYQTELQMAGDNDAAKAELTNKYNLEKDKIEKEQRAADRKRAIFQKTLAAVEIAINTARGVGAALAYGPPVGIVLAAVIAAIGAIQIAAVLSKPIPAFAEGTDSAPGGLALVGEEGPEIVSGRKGTRIVGQNGPELADIERGAKIFTAEETARMREGIATADGLIAGFDDDTQKMRHIKVEVDNSAMTAAISRKFDELIGVTAAQKAPRLDPRGLAREINKGFNMSAFEASEYK
jgi:hypothetical protein